MIHINNLNKNQINKERTFVICDFDRTITKTTSSTTWNIFTQNKFVNPSLEMDAKKLFAYYRAIEQNPNIPIESKRDSMREWAIKEVELFRKYGINQNMFYEIIDSTDTIIFRDDFKLFAIRLQELGIKLYIVSGGIFDVIKYTLCKNGLMLDNISIISNHLAFDNGIITGINGDVIHSCNKEIIQLPISSCESGLLFGDLPGDKLTGYNYDTIDIGFCSDNLKYYNNIFDVVLTGNSSFSNISKILIKNYKNN